MILFNVPRNNSSSPTISYAYNFQLGKYNHLRCALAVSYIYSHLDRNKLTYGNMIDKRYGFIYATKETYGTDSRGAVDFNGGLWYSHNKFYSGVSILHMDRPYTGYSSANQYRISTEVYFTGGYVFRQEKNFHLVPSFVLYRSYELTTLTPTITSTYKNNILFGFSFRDFETISAELAANFYNRFRFFISCGIPIAYQMRSYSAISFFEASIRVQIGRNKSFLESYLK